MDIPQESVHFSEGKRICFDEAISITSVLTEVSDSFSNHGNNAKENEERNMCAHLQMLLFL